MKVKILIIEDDQGIVEAISLALQLHWPESQLVSTHLGEKGVQLVESENPDIVILDLGLPEAGGRIAGIDENDPARVLNRTR